MIISPADAAGEACRAGRRENFIGLRDTVAALSIFLFLLLTSFNDRFWLQRDHHRRRGGRTGGRARNHAPPPSFTVVAPGEGRPRRAPPERTQQRRDSLRRLLQAWLAEGSSLRQRSRGDGRVLPRTWNCPRSMRQSYCRNGGGRTTASGRVAQAR